MQTGFPERYHPLSQPLNNRVLACGQRAKARLYLVGGYIRDALLDRFSAQNQPKDFDYAVADVSAVEFAAAVAEELRGHYVLLDNKNDTARVVLNDGVQIDFAGCQGGTIQNDVKRRDFTVNALVWDPLIPEAIVDYVNGVVDLADRQLRVVSDTVLGDDPLRLLRAFRFQASLKFEIEPHTRQLIAEHAPKLAQSAPERISYEMFAIMESSAAFAAVEEMGKLGLLEVVFPELAATHNVPKNSHHHLGLYDHSLEALRQCELACGEFGDYASSSFGRELAHNTSRLAATKLACLLHDIGKPETWVVQDDGKHTFIGHDKLGAQMSDAMARRMKWSKQTQTFISELIRWHLRPGQLYHQGVPTERAVHRFYRNMGDIVPELILLAMSDFRSTCGPSLQEGRQLLENQLRELLNSYIVFKEGITKTPRLLDGADVMKLLGLKPGPVVGEILELLEEAQGLREVHTKEEAKAFVRKLWDEKYST